MTGDDVWLAYQLNRPSCGDGIIVAFRRKDNNNESMTVRLRGIKADNMYILFNEDTRTDTTISGGDLRNGYPLNLKERPGSVLIRYKVKP